MALMLGHEWYLYASIHLVYVLNGMVQLAQSVTLIVDGRWCCVS